MTTYITDAARKIAEPLVKGPYQTGLLGGWNDWTGKDLIGRAAQNFGGYARSREGLQSRLRAAGLRVTVARIGAVPRGGCHAEMVACIATEAEARRIRRRDAGDVREGRAMETRIDRIERAAAAAARKEAKIRAADEALLATLPLTDKDAK